MNPGSKTNNGNTASFEPFGILLVCVFAVLPICYSVFADDPEWCAPWDCTSYPTRTTTSWTIEDNVEATGDEGRVIVVVESVLYDVQSVATNVDTYAEDLQNEGYGVIIAVINKYGLAEDLRDELYDIYQEEDSLVGAVFVGAVPWITYEYLVDPEMTFAFYTEFPTDAFFMDLDGTWEKGAEDCDCDDNVCADEAYDCWDGSAAEIWVSRIRVDNLTALLAEDNMEESEVIIAYLQRNHAHRTQDVVFGSAEDNVIAIDDYTDTSFCPPRGVEDLEDVFATVDYWCYGDATYGHDYQDYEDMLEDDNPYYWVHFHAHGNYHGHDLADGHVGILYYLDRDTGVRGFTFAACSTCNFIVDDNLGGTVCFNPEADTLWVLGHSKTVAGSDNDQFLEGVAAGKSIGESFKEFFNSDSCRDPRSMVLFGDGTLKPPRATWTGGGLDDLWDTVANWDTGVEPGGNDHVFIPDDDSDPTVDVNVGSYETPHPVASVCIVEGDSSGDVTINIQQDKGLKPRGPLMAESGISAEVAMEVNSKLELDRSFIKNVDITMAGHATTPPYLYVEESIEDSTLTVGAYSYYSGHHMLDIQQPCRNEEWRWFCV